MSFKVGDRVRLIGSNDTGVVKVIGNPNNATAIGVEFDIPFDGGYDCIGHCAAGRGFWLNAQDLQYETTITPQALSPFGLGGIIIKYNGFPLGSSVEKTPPSGAMVYKSCKCECGAEKCGSARHSDYCPKYRKEA